MEHKKQFRIGELAKQLALERFVIRFWEKEFNVVGQRSEGGQRFYTQHDLDHFADIKKLLYDEGFTIAGAKKILEQKSSMFGSHKTTLEPVGHVVQDIESLRMIGQELKKIRIMLEAKNIF